MADISSMNDIAAKGMAYQKATGNTSGDLGYVLSHDWTPPATAAPQPLLAPSPQTNLSSPQPIAEPSGTPRRRPRSVLPVILGNGDQADTLG